MDRYKDYENMAKIRAENKKLKEARLCKICREYVANRLLLPCSHIAVCPLCLLAIVVCPICKQKINGIVSVYFA